MSAIVNIILFLIILFLYIHIIHQLKKGEDLEIYEMDYMSNEHLQEVCDIKQPVLFEYQSVVPAFFEHITPENLDNFSGSHDIKIKDIQDYWKSDESVDYVILPYQSGRTLMSSDTQSNYFTENNEDFVDDSGLNKIFKENDEFLKPYMTLQTKYDIMTGSANVYTPLRYHTEYRKFLCVMSGKIRVKMTPWKSKKYLYPTRDFENYEFKSPINAWKPQRKYLHEMDKIKWLEFDVQPNHVLYIPPFWWYSIQYSDTPDNFICGITYNSIMNCVTNIPNWGLYFLQQNNIQKKIAKTLELDKPDLEKSEDTAMGLKIVEKKTLVVDDTEIEPPSIVKSI